MPTSSRTSRCTASSRFLGSTKPARQEKKGSARKVGVVGQQGPAIVALRPGDDHSRRQPGVGVQAAPGAMPGTLIGQRLCRRTAATAEAVVHVPGHDLYGSAGDGPDLRADLAPQTPQLDKARRAGVGGLLYGDTRQTVERPEEVRLLGRAPSSTLPRTATDTEHQARYTRRRWSGNRLEHRGRRLWPVTREPPAVQVRHAVAPVRLPAWAGVWGVGPGAAVMCNTCPGAKQYS